MGPPIRQAIVIDVPVPSVKVWVFHLPSPNLVISNSISSSSTEETRYVVKPSRHFGV